MSVAHDAVSESHTGTAGVASVASFTWNHAGGASARSALVFTLAIGANPVTGVTYGGVAMTDVPYTAYDSDTEPGFVQAWFLDNCGSGTKAVVVSRTNNAVVTYATCMTQTGAKRCQVYLAGVKTRAAAGAEQTAASSSATGTATAWSSMTLDDGSPGTNSIRYLGIYSGASSVSAASTNLTTNGTSASIDFGNYVFFTMRETTPSQGAKALTIATAITDDLAVIGLAIREDPDDRNASVTATGGGVATTAATKGATLAGAFTAGGMATLAPKGAHTKVVTATGGGVLTSSSATQRSRAVTATGGGTATSSTRKGAQLAASVTGGGTAVVTGVKAIVTVNRDATIAATGGGVATVTSSSQRAGAAAATVGGQVSLSVRSARQLAAAMTGGGAAAVEVTSSRYALVEATGAGVAIVDGQKGAVGPTIGLAALMRQTDADGAPAIAAPSDIVVTSLSDAPVITSARFIP